KGAGWTGATRHAAGRGRGHDRGRPRHPGPVGQGPRARRPPGPPAGRRAAGRRPAPPRRPPAGAHRRRLAHAGPGRGAGRRPAAAGFLTGGLRPGRIGAGWRTVASVEAPPAAAPSLAVLALDRALAELAALRGPGSQRARAALLADLLGRATPGEQDLIRRLLVGELRHGALEGLATDAVARAFGVPLATVRRAAMLAGDLARVAVVARDGGEAGLAAIGLTLLRPVKPMLAQSAGDVAEAMALATGGEGRPASVEWKLDGARIQVHREGDDVRIYTRNLNDVTERLPGVVALVRSLPARALLLDGEAIGVDEGE